MNEAKLLEEVGACGRILDHAGRGDGAPTLAEELSEGYGANLGGLRRVLKVYDVRSHSCTKCGIGKSEALRDGGRRRDAVSVADGASAGDSRGARAPLVVAGLIGLCLHEALNTWSARCLQCLRVATGAEQ